MKQYSSYIDSGIQWLNEIPAHWKILPGRALFTENKEKNDGGEHQVLSLSYGSIIIKKNVNEGLIPENYSSYQYIRPGYIIVRCTDLQNDKVSLRTSISEYEGIITGAYLGLIPKPICRSKFIHYLLRAWDCSKELYRYGSGLRQSLSWNDFKYLLLPIPTPEEQDAIVAYLDAATAKIDEAIAQQQRMIDLLNEREQVIIDKAALGGLNSAVELQDSGNDWIGLIPKHWRINKFRYLFKTRTGITFTKAQLEDEGEPVISYGQIHSKDNWGASVNPELIRHIPSELTKGKEGALAMPGDFLFADTSEDFEGCGNNVFIDSKPVYAGYHTILARNNHQEYGPYLAYLFTSTRWRGQVRSMVNGVKVYSITQGILNSANVILPPKEEQKEIADYIATRVIKLDEGVRRHKEYIKVFQERKQIIINDVVTGKVKVI